jgi:hypothetical protein
LAIILDVAVACLARATVDGGGGEIALLTISGLLSLIGLLTISGFLLR